MDSGHMVEALSTPLFKKHFLGFLFSDALSLLRKEHDYLDFYVINTNHVFGEHWFTCVRGRTKWIIFDCSVFTPKEYHDGLKEILSKEAPVVFDCSQLQRPTSLSCGPHVLSFLYFFFKTKMKQNLSYPVNYYSKKLLKFCRMNEIFPDIFVHYLVYDSSIFKIKMENEKTVNLWLKHFQ